MQTLLYVLHSPMHTHCKIHLPSTIAALTRLNRAKIENTNAAMMRLSLVPCQAESHVSMCTVQIKIKFPLRIRRTLVVLSVG